ncbi:MAG: helix-turn-helix transcriptional regulator [Proteobacteria bacterium]|nr:helix-turn-helix transcriptional regulator [Pseudomonadota bacterium]MBI3496173.1 helix-turn-helix transcriptional regulator [Pseudomonadota bacterium]
MLGAAGGLLATLIGAAPPLGLGGDGRPDRRVHARPFASGLTEAAPIPILNFVVKYQQAALDRTFAALADPTRRTLLAQLSQDESRSVSELARPFAMSLPAVMKHLDVLSEAGLIQRVKSGRTVACQLTARPMEDAVNWLNRYARFWSEQLDRLAAYVENEACRPSPTSPSSPASHSSAASTRRRRKSTAPGRCRRK